MGFKFSRLLARLDPPIEFFHFRTSDNLVNFRVCIARIGDFNFVHHHAFNHPPVRTFNEAIFIDAGKA